MSPIRPTPSQGHHRRSRRGLHALHGMNPGFKPFSDKRVRQAINHAIDTDLIISKLVKGKAYRATSWLPLTSPLYDKTMKPYAFDPRRRSSCSRTRAIPQASNSNGPRARMKAGACRSSRPLSDAGPSGHQGEGQAGRDRGAGGARSQGDFQAYIYSQSTVRIPRQPSNASTRRRRNRPATT